METIQLTPEEERELLIFLISLYPKGRTLNQILDETRKRNLNWDEKQLLKYAKTSLDNLILKRLCKKEINENEEEVIILSSNGVSTVRTQIKKFFQHDGDLSTFVKIMNKLIHVDNDPWAIIAHEKLLLHEVYKTIEIFGLLRNPQYMSKFIADSAKVLRMDANDKGFLTDIMSSISRLHKLGLVVYKKNSDIIEATDVGDRIYLEVMKNLKLKTNQTISPSTASKGMDKTYPLKMSFVKYFVFVTIVSVGIAIFLQAIFAIIGIPTPISLIYPAFPIFMFYGGIYLETSLKKWRNKTPAQRSRS